MFHPKQSNFFFEYVAHIWLLGYITSKLVNEFSSSNSPLLFQNTEENRGEHFNYVVDLQGTANLALAAAACCHIHSCVALHESICCVSNEFSVDAVNIN